MAWYYKQFIAYMLAREKISQQLASRAFLHDLLIIRKQRK
jgi:hypothetical protein